MKHIAVCLTFFLLRSPACQTRLEINEAVNGSGSYSNRNIQ